MRGYGRDFHCCSKECFEEFDWRRAIAITNRVYVKSWRQHQLDKAEAASVAAAEARMKEGP
jgi:hypothetical protein